MATANTLSSAGSSSQMTTAAAVVSLGERVQYLLAHVPNQHHQRKHQRRKEPQRSRPAPTWFDHILR